MHIQVIEQLLRYGVHVYADKWLAETPEQGELLIVLAEKQGKALMVGFNRRFAPRYRQLKMQMSGPAAIRMDKHRAARWAVRSAYFAGRRFPRGGYRAVADGGKRSCSVAAYTPTRLVNWCLPNTLSPAKTPW